MSRKNWNEEDIAKLTALKMEGKTWEDIAAEMGLQSANMARKAFYRYNRDGVTPQGQKTGPKILVLDIETAPIEAYVWGMFNQNIGLEQVITNTTVISWSAKWMGAPADTIMYKDQRDAKDIRDDKELLEPLWSLLDEADCVLTQNGVGFDIPKLNYRFAKNKFKPYSKFKDIDTLKIAKKVFGFDSNKLAHMTDLFCTKYKKLSHKKYPGFLLWQACMKGDKAAFKEMEEYNKVDVLSLEELYVDHFLPWDDSLNFAAWSDEYKFRCNCGNDELVAKGFHITKKSKFQKYICTNCGKEHRGSENLFSKEKRKELKV
jgi:hypothetical protein